MILRTLRWFLCGVVFFITLGILAAFVFQIGVFDPTPRGLLITPRRTRLPEPTFFQEDGLPNFVETLNLAAKKGVRPEDNFAIDCLRALGRLEASEKDWMYLRQAMEFDIDPSEPTLSLNIRGFYQITASKTLGNLPWRSEDYPMLAEMLDGNHDLLMKLRESSKKPRFYLPRVPHPSGSCANVELVHEYAMRDVIRQFAYDAARSAQVGEYAYSLDNAEAVMRFARHLEESPTDIVRILVAQSFRSTGLQLLQMLSIQIHAKRPPDSNALLVRIRELIEKNEKETDFHNAMDVGERFDCENSIMRMGFYGPASQKTTNKLPPVSKKFLNSCDWSKIVDDAQLFIDRIAELLTLDDYQKVRGLTDEINQNLYEYDRNRRTVDRKFSAMVYRKARTNDMKEMMLGQFMPAYDAVVTIRFRAIAQTRLTFITTLLAQHALEQGDYPKRLEELQVDANSNWLIDPFTSKFFEYRVDQKEARYILYSKGPNMLDDQGNVREVGVDDISCYLPNLEGLPFDPLEKE